MSARVTIGVGNGHKMDKAYTDAVATSHTEITTLLHGCYNLVIGLLQGCYKVVTRLFYFQNSTP